MSNRNHHPIIDEARLWRTIEELGSIGMDASGGVTRLSLSSSELQGRAYIKQLMREAGLDVSEDAAGNIIGRLHGERPQEAVVMTGSHIDTVIHAGRFDGALGVLGGIEALRAIKEHGMSHARTLEVVCFTDEEGVRFGVGYLGSRAMAGDWKPEWLSETDAEGITLAEAMKQRGCSLKRSIAQHGVDQTSMHMSSFILSRDACWSTISSLLGSRVRCSATGGWRSA